jgi:hypothetical protein
MHTYGGMEVWLQTFLTLTPSGGEWLSSCPVHFTPEETIQYPLDRRLGGPQSQSGHGDELKNAALQRINMWSFSHSLTTILTELSQLSAPHSRPMHIKHITFTMQLFLSWAALLTGCHNYLSVTIQMTYVSYMHYAMQADKWINTILVALFEKI